MAETKIEWTDKTWNPITGCTKKSEGCVHCYAEMMARRLKGMRQIKYKNAFKLTLHPEDLERPRSGENNTTFSYVRWGIYFMRMFPLSLLTG